MFSSSHHWHSHVQDPFDFTQLFISSPSAVALQKSTRICCSLESFFASLLTDVSETLLPEQCLKFYILLHWPKTLKTRTRQRIRKAEDKSIDKVCPLPKSEPLTGLVTQYCKTLFPSNQRRKWRQAQKAYLSFVYICCCCISTGCLKKNEPIKQTKIAKHGRLVNIPKWFKRVRNGQPRCF